MEVSGAEKVSLEASWSRLGAFKTRQDSPAEIGRRSGRGKVSIFGWPWPLGSATYQRISIDNNNKHQLYRRSEHALGQKPGEFLKDSEIVLTQFALTI